MQIGGDRRDDLVAGVEDLGGQRRRAGHHERLVLDDGDGEPALARHEQRRVGQPQRHVRIRRSGPRPSRGRRPFESLPHAASASAAPPAAPIARNCRRLVRITCADGSAGTRRPGRAHLLRCGHEQTLGPYTPVVRAGDWIIVSGQLGVQDGALVDGGVAAQTAQAVANLAAQLATMGASLADVAKTLCFLTDMDTFATFNEAYVAGFGDHRPARSTIGVAAPARAAAPWRSRPGPTSRPARRRVRSPCPVPSTILVVLAVASRCILHGLAPSSPPRSAWSLNRTARSATRAASCST